MRKLLNRKIVAQDRKCDICQEQFDGYNDIVPDHRCPKGYGRRSARRSSGQHPSRALVVQFEERIEQACLMKCAERRPPNWHGCQLVARQLPRQLFSG
jgi:hypothetical protein